MHLCELRKECLATYLTFHPTYPLNKCPMSLIPQRSVSAFRIDDLWLFRLAQSFGILSWDISEPLRLLCFCYLDKVSAEIQDHRDKTIEEDTDAIVYFQLMKQGGGKIFFSFLCIVQSLTTHARWWWKDHTLLKWFIKWKSAFV